MKRFLFILSLALSMTAFSFVQSVQSSPSSWGEIARHSTTGSGQSIVNPHPTKPIHPTTPAHPVTPVHPVTPAHPLPPNMPIGY